MKKIVVEDTYNLKLGEMIGRITTVERENEGRALFDKETSQLLSPYLKETYILFGKEHLLFKGYIDDTLKGYIYNYKTKECYASDINIIYDNRSGLIAYYDLKTELYYILKLDDKTKLEFNYVEQLFTYDGMPYFKVKNKEGFGLYCVTKCIVPVGSVKSIDKDLVVTNLNGKQYYLKDKEEKSEEFDEIKKYSNFTIAKNDGVVYCYHKDELIFQTLCEELIPTEFNIDYHDHNDSMYFIIKEDGKKGIIKVNGDYSFGIMSSIKKPNYVVPTIYDDIKWEKRLHRADIYYLYLDGNIGLYSSAIKTPNNLIEAEYQEITSLGADKFLFSFLNEKKIIDISTIKVLANDVSDVYCENDHIIYTKNNKKGILYRYNGDFAIDNLDDIEHVKRQNMSNYYAIKKDDLMGLVMDAKLVIPFKENQYIEYFEGRNIFVIYDLEGTHICEFDYLSAKNYNELYTIPEIYRVEYLGKNASEKDMFDINGTIYEYDYHNFKEAMMYYALYELENGSIFSATNDRVIHEEFEKSMEETPEEEIEKTLIKMKK